ncbi:MAG: 4Fe-4S dicluster domain-containing protein [archaeon]
MAETPHKKKRAFSLPKENLRLLLAAIKPIPFIPFEGRFQEYKGRIAPMENLTMISPVKSFLFPDGAESFRFNLKGQAVVKKGNAQKEKIVFGVNPLDILALETLESIFRKNPAYSGRRKATLIIGMGDYSRAGAAFDVFFHDNGLDYLAVAGTPRGERFLAKYRKFFGATDTQVPETGRRDSLLIDPEKLREAVKNAPKEVWEEVARTCLGCGICSYVCPLCYCFEVDDSVPIGEKTGARCTRWDSCMLESFSAVAGGHVFQKELSSRIKNWYYHKFARATAERGTPDCVGCDRCFHFCPVAINFREVLSKCQSKSR